jgi:hypothetical protein
MVILGTCAEGGDMYFGRSGVGKECVGHIGRCEGILENQSYRRGKRG